MTGTGAVIEVQQEGQVSNLILVGKTYSQMATLKGTQQEGH